MNNLDLSQVVCLTTYDLLWFGSITALLTAIFSDLLDLFWKFYHKRKRKYQDSQNPKESD